MVYVFDTNSLRVLGNYYPGRFPSFWERFETLIRTGEVVSVREVHNELLDQITKEWFLDWVEKHKQMFVVPAAEETEFVAEIFRVPHFLTLVGREQQLKGQPVADPFVIACARIRAGTVVTEEGNKPNAAKIPNVCQHFRVPCTNVEGFLTACNWQF